MLHYHTNHETKIIDSFSLILKENGIVLDKSVTEDKVREFELNNKVALPEDLKHFLLGSNGFAADEMYAMSRFWRLGEYTSVSNYFKANVIKDRTPENDLLLSKRLVDINGKWLLLDVDNFYLFGDYNSNGSYWAIQLSPDNQKETIIICISDFSNIYSVVANSFTQFINIFYNQCPEELL
jgi:SMI1 / KNR4 family (SUKH-1)